MRLTAVVLVILLAAPMAFAGENDPESAASRCPDLREMAGVGLVCPIAPGLFEVFSARTGDSLGFTHGPDPRCESCGEPAVVEAASSAPYCVSSTSTEYNVVVIYARAAGDVDRYTSMVSSIRTLVNSANAALDDAAIATGDRLAMRLKCTSGIVDVASAVLPTAMGSASFSTIVEDLKDLGYDSNRKKYWVYYDDSGACACAGTGHIYSDDSNSVNNANNGASSSVPMFAVSFDSNSVRTMLHELGHNLGAVQNSAPHSSLAGHCYDGRDTMCYNDGGSNGSLYSTSSCGVEVFDCGKDDYCHANPAAGSYLATHWQVCHRQSRFLEFEGNVAPMMTALSCAPDPIEAGELLTCSFSATDANVGVYYRIAWGDGATTRVPASGTVTPGTTQVATHTYAAEGTPAVSVNATDSGTPVLTSTDATYSLTVVPLNTAPVVNSISCTPSSPFEDEIVTCSFSATDSSNVYYTVSWADGSPSVRIPESGAVPPGDVQSPSHTYANPANYTVNVTVTDVGSPPKSSALTQAITVQDVNEAPVMTGLACPTAFQGVGAAFSCNFAASDDSSGVRYRIEWGDGQQSLAPASGYYAPGSVRDATHAYTVAGDYTVNVSAEDNGSPARTSGLMAALVQVRSDFEGPIVIVQDPREGVVYVGCTRNISPGRVPITYLTSGCVRVSATDVSGVSRVEVWRKGKAIAVDTQEPYELTFPIESFERGADYLIRAFDNIGIARNVPFKADVIGGSG